jgi:hypothetical protein
MMADPDKMAALQKHLDELQNESPEDLAERYGLSTQDSRAFQDAMSTWRGPLVHVMSGISKVLHHGASDLEGQSMTGRHYRDTRSEELEHAEELRQPERSATEMIDALKKKEQTSYGDK